MGAAMPDPITVGLLVGWALKLGAEAVVKSAVGEAVKDAYAALKNKLSVWAGGDVAALEKQPNSSARQAVITEIVDSLSAADQASLRSLAQVLTNELEKQAPKIIGLDVGRLKALQVEFGNIAVTEGTGVRIQEADVEGTFKTGEISVGPSLGKR
jgi:hypothetical protein